MKADKPGRHCKVDAGMYHKDVNRFYKRHNIWEKNFNYKAKKIAKELKTDGRIHKFHKQKAFITVNDH